MFVICSENTKVPPMTAVKIEPIAENTVMKSSGMRMNVISWMTALRI